MGFETDEEMRAFVRMLTEDQARVIVERLVAEMREGSPLERLLGIPPCPET